MKVKEIKTVGGRGGSDTYIRVRLLAAGEEVPNGSETVPDDTPEHDWKREGEL